MLHIVALKRTIILTNADLDNADLINADLSNVVLEKTIFSCESLKNC